MRGNVRVVFVEIDRIFVDFGWSDSQFPTMTRFFAKDDNGRFCCDEFI